MDNQGTKRVQGIVCALLYYALAVDNKLLVSLSAIILHQSTTTQRTNDAINQILDYCATYSANGILYRSRNMVLFAHSDAGFHNESKGHRIAGDHIFFSKNDACPDGTALFSLLPILLNLLYPLLQKHNWGHFSSQLKKWWK